MTSEQDRILAFKKLTMDSEYWYDRTKKGETEIRPNKKTKTEDLRPSCPKCGNPMYEKALTEDPTKKIMACSNHPHCRADQERPYYVFFL